MMPALSTITISSTKLLDTRSLYNLVKMAETNQVNIKINNNKVWFFWGVGINAASPLTAIICML